MEVDAPVYAIGDVHGQIEKVARLLRDAELVDDDLHWTGSEATLWFMGDFFDRGPGPIASVDLVMRLEAEAAQVGGVVRALMGNHEVQLVAAQRFPDARSTGPGGTFMRDWEKNGGEAKELASLSDVQLEWVLGLPFMAHGRERLFVHADSRFYEQYGEDVATANEALHAVVRGDDLQALDQLLHRFSDRDAFVDPLGGGTTRAREFLDTFGGKQLIHGHTPIDKITHLRPEDVTHAHVYADGLCVNVDGGMYRGGPGFIYTVVETGVIVL